MCKALRIVQESEKNISLLSTGIVGIPFLLNGTKQLEHLNKDSARNDWNVKCNKNILHIRLQLMIMKHLSSQKKGMRRQGVESVDGHTKV